MPQTHVQIHLLNLLQCHLYFISGLHQDRVLWPLVPHPAIAALKIEYTQVSSEDSHASCLGEEGQSELFPQFPFLHHLEKLKGRSKS